MDACMHVRHSTGADCIFQQKQHKRFVVLLRSYTHLGGGGRGGAGFGLGGGGWGGLGEGDGGGGRGGRGDGGGGCGLHNDNNRAEQ